MKHLTKIGQWILSLIIIGMLSSHEFISKKLNEYGFLVSPLEIVKTSIIIIGFYLIFKGINNLKYLMAYLLLGSITLKYAFQLKEIPNFL